MSDNITIRPSVSDSTRRALETIGNHLIPEAHGMPAAGTMGVGTTQLEILPVSPSPCGFLAIVNRTRGTPARPVFRCPASASPA